VPKVQGKRGREGTLASTGTSGFTSIALSAVCEEAPMPLRERINGRGDTTL
jgi:hypothetical protein